MWLELRRGLFRREVIVAERRVSTISGELVGAAVVGSEVGTRVAGADGGSGGPGDPR